MFKEVLSQNIENKSSFKESKYKLFPKNSNEL